MTEFALLPSAERRLIQDVVQHKSRFFAAAWASYDTARPGGFHLVPPPHRLRELARDHEAMRPMFLGEEPSFEELVQQLRENEDALNATGEPGCG